jgi:hypothetical protein
MKKTQEELRILMELRRSNAATAIPNKKKYTRKAKHKMSQSSSIIKESE